MDIEATAIMTPTNPHFFQICPESATSSTLRRVSISVAEPTSPKSWAHPKENDAPEPVNLISHGDNYRITEEGVSMEYSTENPIEAIDWTNTIPRDLTHHTMDEDEVDFEDEHFYEGEDVIEACRIAGIDLSVYAIHVEVPDLYDAVDYEDEYFYL